METDMDGSIYHERLKPTTLDEMQRDLNAERELVEALEKMGAARRTLALARRR